MTSGRIEPTDEAIKAAAKALREHNPFVSELQADPETPQDEFECCARVVLEAALPLLETYPLGMTREQWAKHVESYR